MKKLFVLVAIAMSSILTGFAHHIIRGTVLNADNSDPLTGASVTIKGTSTGVITNESGYFEIGVEAETVSLVFSYIGFESRELDVHEHDGKLTVLLSPSTVKLAQVSVNSGGIKTLANISKIDINIRPVNTSQEVLSIVPGLFIAQHAGGGKAEQIFLRGFDIDHGTDIAITADGMPANMVSHAHGQGYADLHFVIPEIINIVDFGKGLYYTDKGNLNTAGYVDIKTHNTLDRSMVKMEAGDFQTFRTVAAINLLGSAAAQKGHNAYVAAEYNATNGPFEAPQNFNRINLLAKYAGYFSGKNLVTLQLSRLNSKWDASGQIPDRAVESGQISRFGAIDPTEGGNTQRTNLSVKLLSNIKPGLSTENQFYFTRYYFELYSNFTFYLNNPILGDQIRQREFRDIYGFLGKISKETYWKDAKITGTLGYGFRFDEVKDIELTNTIERQTDSENRALGDIFETNGWLYFDGKLEHNKWLLNGGIRLDGFKFDYYNKLATQYSTLSQQKMRVSPKLNLIYSATNNISLYLKSGVGFHSNDTRVVVANNGQDILPAAYGVDLGTNYKPFQNVYINIAAWYLFLEQEFVYVGDEAVVEPSGKTQRLGADFTLRWTISSWLFADFDLTYAHGKSVEDEEGQNYISLAPDLTSTGGLNFKTDFGINGSLRYRYIKDRPANEDNSIVALGYTVIDARLNYTRKSYEVFIGIENLFNTVWNEAQFATLSRLRTELVPVEELHYTPGTPFFIKGGVSVYF